MTQFLNQVGDAVADMTAGVQKELRGMHKGAIGTEPRTGQEKAWMWRRMKLLSDDDFNRTGDIIAAKTGHKTDESSPCSWCSFLQEMALK